MNPESVFEYIPIERQIEKFQDEYYDAIAQCHVDGASIIFIEFMLLQIDKIQPGGADEKLDIAGASRRK